MIVRNRRNFLRISLAALLAPALARAQDRPRVVAVHAMLTHIAQRLAGDAAEVVMPVPAGRDPEFWRPAIADIAAIQQAELILLNGAGFAAWTTKVTLPRSKTVDTTRGLEDRFITTNTVTHSHGADGAHSHAGTASYTWLDPDMAAAQAETVAEALIRRRIAGRGGVEARLAEIRTELGEISARIAALGPLAGGRPVIATHPRYHYLARAAGLDIRALSWDAGAPPDAAQLAELERLATQTGARVLIWEAAPPQAARETVAGMGLTDCVFPTFAMAGAEPVTLAAYGRAIDALTAALEAAGT